MKTISVKIIGLGCCLLVYLFMTTSCLSLDPSLWNNTDSYNSTTTSNNSSNDCEVKYWVDYKGGYYVPYFQKECDRALSLDYALYYMDGTLFREGHLYFTKISTTPGSGHYAKSPIRIKIISENWD